MNYPIYAHDEYKHSNVRNISNPGFFSLRSANQENMNISNITPSENNHTIEVNNLKSASKATMPMENNIRDLSLYPFYMNDSLIISPIKDYNAKDYPFTPLKNESGYYSPLIPFEFRIETPNDQKYGSSARRILFSKEKNPILGRKISFNNNYIDEPNKANEAKICCTCTKTNCQKKYCACFNKGRFCEGCDCKNCLNQPIGSTPFANPASNAVPICNCTKSNCTKKYCECFKVGKKCGSLCRCVNCINSFRENNKPNHQLDLFTEAYGIEIAKGKMNIKKRTIQMVIFDEEDIQLTPKVTKKKKMKIKTESTRLNTATPVGDEINLRSKRMKRRRPID